MIKQIITNELAHETETLQKLKSSKGKLSNLVLSMSSEGKFYYYALDTETGEHRFFTNYNDHQAFVATQNYG